MGRSVCFKTVFGKSEGLTTLPVADPSCSPGAEAGNQSQRPDITKKKPCQPQTEGRMTEEIKQTKRRKNRNCKEQDSQMPAGV